MMHESILTNLMMLLRCGAFDLVGQEQAVPMSNHKWRKLVVYADSLGIMPQIADGAQKLRGMKYMAPCLYATIEGMDSSIYAQTYQANDPHMFNHWTEKRLGEVKEEEMNAADTSEETLNLLDLIVQNAADIITSDISIAGMVRLGQHIRRNAEAIDYDKLNQWLSHIGLVQVASLEGSVLISCFDFSEEEVPFVRKSHSKARRLFMNSLTKTGTKHHFSNSTRMNVAMLETMSYRFMAAISKVTDIEE